MPFLPGDSLLFIVGALCGIGLMSFPIACVVLIAAQIYVWLRKPKVVAEEKAIEAQVPATSYSEVAE